MKNLIKKQEEKLNRKFVSDSCVGANDNLEDYELFMTNVKVRDIKKLVKEFRKETAEAVCDKMIGKMRVPEYPLASRVLGYNQRIKEEKEIKKQIIKHMKNEEGILIAKIRFKEPIIVKTGDFLEMNFQINPENQKGELTSVKKINKSNK